MNLALYLWNDDSGQDIAEYAVMLAVILVIVVAEGHFYRLKPRNNNSCGGTSIGGIVNS